MNVNGVEHIPISRRKADEIYAAGRASVAHDLEAIPAAAAEIARWTRDETARIVDFLVESAPVMTPDEEKKARKRAAKKIRRVRDAAVRGYVSPDPDELSVRAAIDAEKATQRMRRVAKRELDDEEAGDRPLFADGALDYAALMERPPLTPLVAGVLNTETVGMLYAPPATYKTFFALWLAACVALGKKWAGREVKGGPVLYIAAEGAAGIQKRVAALSWMLNRGKPIPDFFIYPAPVDLTSDSDRDQVAAFVAEHGIALTVADTLVKVAGGAEENDNTAMTRVTNAAEHIRRAHEGSTFLFVHHSGKSGDYRGASALLGNVDTMLKLEGDAATLILTAVKQKDAEGGEIIRLRAKPVAEHDTLVLEPIAPGQSQPTGVQAARVEEALAHFVRAFSETGATQPQFVEALVEWGVGSRSASYGYVNELVKSGRLRKTGTPTRSRLELAPELTSFPLD